MKKNGFVNTRFLLLLTTTLMSFFISSCSGKGGGIAPSMDQIIGDSSSVSISPSSVSLSVGNLQTFTAAGGTAPYTYSIFSGSGSILSTTGAFTAPGVSGSTVVRVTDSSGQFADAVVTVVDALQISPTSQSLGINGTQQFSATGGVAPLAYTKVSGVGSVSSSGLYSAGSSAGTAVIRVTDSLGNTSDANVSVFSALGISPASANVTVNNTVSFSAAGGTSPYTYSVISGSGTVNAGTGVYTAPATSGSATVRVTDNVGATADALITVYNALVISPAVQTVLTSSTITFSATGGDGNYAYSIISGTGTLDSATGDFTAPASSGTTVVRVNDGLGNFSDSTITVTSQIYISPVSTILAVSNTQTFSGSGGLPPYTFSVVSGAGSVNASTGLYTAPASAGSATVRVTDSLGASADATVMVNAALTIAPSAPTVTSITGSIIFSASGGVPPYTFSLFSGTGSVNASTGSYTAPNSAGSDIVRVTDSFGNHVDATVNIITGLGINPAGVTVTTNSTYAFAGLNGTPPYTFSVLSGGGSVNASTGLYTAPVTAGSAVVRVTDSTSATADATVTITPSVQISPTTKTLAVNNTFSFTASGGVTPYTYSIVSGGGSINASSGAFTAPASSGSVTVRVTDNNGGTSNATVTVNAVLAIAPTAATISVVDTKTFTASGGVSPYAYSITSGAGSINSSTGVYTPSTAGTITLKVTDSLNNTSSTTLTVNAALAISPITAYVVTDTDLQLTGSGGVPTYSYSITAGSGVIDSVTGIYTAPSTTGSATVRVTDSFSPTAHTASATITIYAPLTISPTTVTLAANGTQTFTAAGGVGSKTFSVFSGAGTVDSVTGAYTAPAANGTDTVRVTDAIGNYVDASVTIVSSLTISPSTLKLPVFSTVTYTSILGTSPYTYSIFAGSGTVNSSTGLHTAPATAGTGTVRVTDNVGATSDSAVTYIEPVEITNGSYHSCVRYSEGSVKCWGDAAFGQLGSGSTADLGDSSTEFGGALPFVNLGTGRTATALAAGISHSCAILDNSTLKCWGYNLYGQLGIGNTTSKGDNGGEMGDSLAAVNLGTGRTPSKVFAFGYVTCVILDNGQTKCFGRNNYGQLGQGVSTTALGTTAAQMSSLAAINLGTGRTATKLSGGADFTCALLDNSTVKCFGRNNNGQLGVGSITTIGTSAAQMGDALAAVNLGTGRTAIDIASGYSHTCALLDNSTIKCWGRNQSGQLGIGSTTTIGTSTAQMGDSLAVVPLSSFTATKLYAGRQMSCASSASNAVRCWGYNAYGQLLVGSVSALGDGAGEAAALANINFGTGVTMSSMSIGYYTGCAIMNNKRIKCWGNALNGALLNGTTSTYLGDTAGELGDGLPYVNH